MKYIKNYRGQDICGHCHKYLDEGDKYCRYCGTKRGEGKFLPFQNEMVCLYGPPLVLYFKCKKCKHKYKKTVIGFMGDAGNYCPNCGASKPKLIYEKDVGIFEEINDTVEEIKIKEKIKFKIKKLKEKIWWLFNK